MDLCKCPEVPSHGRFKLVGKMCAGHYRAWLRSVAGWRLSHVFLVSSSIPQNLTWWVDGEDAYPKRLPRVLVQLTRLAFNAFLNRRNRLKVSEQSKTMSECERCSVELVRGLVPQAKVPDYRFRGRWVTQHSGPLFFGGGVAAAAFVFLCFSPHWRVFFFVFSAVSAPSFSSSSSSSRLSSQKSSHTHHSLSHPHTHTSLTLTLTLTSHTHTHITHHHTHTHIPHSHTSHSHTHTSLTHTHITHTHTHHTHTHITHPHTHTHTSLTHPNTSLTHTHTYHSVTHTYITHTHTHRLGCRSLLRSRRGTWRTAKGSDVRPGAPCLWRPLVSAALPVVFAWQAWHLVHCKGAGCTPWRPSGVSLASLGLRRSAAGGFCVASVRLRALQRGRRKRFFHYYY